MKTGRTSRYAGVIDIPEGKINGVEIRHVHHPAGWEASTTTARGQMFGQKGGKIRFPEPTRWHELSEDDHGVWMTDLPIEQRQHDELIVKAKGRVLVGGLGVGYAVNALAAHPRVTEITVVEITKEIIDLVWMPTVTSALRYATAAGKPDLPISIAHADLSDFLKTYQGPAFDWGLFDIWQRDNEGTFHEVVVPLRRLAHGKVKHLECWNEDIMRGQLANGLEHKRMIFVQQRASAAARAAVNATGDPIPEIIADHVSMFDKMPTLDYFCEPNGSYWQDWAVPFWRWYRDHGQHWDEEAVQFVQRRYALAYGRPELKEGLPLLTNTLTASNFDGRGSAGKTLTI